jgi:hypothetical protein
MRHLFILFFVLVFSSPLYAGTLEGVTMPDTTEVDAKTLVLNGMGLRKKLFVNVYIAGLYLPEKESSTEKILSGDTKRKLVMKFVHDVEKEKICKAWYDGLKNNSPAQESTLKSKFNTLCDYMTYMASGEQMSFTYVPGEGTHVNVIGKDKGTIAGKDFADALFACWIGPNPPGEDFKKGVLGQ